MLDTVQTENLAPYIVHPATESEDAVIERAREILHNRLQRTPRVFGQPDACRDYLMMNLAELEHEVFGVIWVDAQMGMIADEVMFRGTLTQTSVFPREVLKSALAHNACAVILYHNHPSGKADPSPADEYLTKRLKDALDMVDIRVLDHFIVAHAEKPTSFAELGLL